MASPSELFYLQDSRSLTGSAMMFWAKDGNGYTSDLDKAHVYTKDKALAQHRMRETDIPWPKDYIDAKAHRGVDTQMVRSEDVCALSLVDNNFYAALSGEYNGNDLVFVGKICGIRTANLAHAATYSVKDTLAMSSSGYRMLPCSYINAKSRQLVHVEHLSIKQALRGTGIKLTKPKRPRRYVSNCDGCGRFLSEMQIYGTCHNCGTNNAP